MCIILFIVFFLFAVQFKYTPQPFCLACKEIDKKCNSGGSCALKAAACKAN